MSNSIASTSENNFNQYLFLTFLYNSNFILNFNGLLSNTVT